MAYKLMIQGTMSSAGKSFLVTGLCRLFSNMGYRVAPFKSQNMALNSGVTFDGCEMGRAQIVQAEAARTIPDVRMNPILLKPNSDVGSQVIVMGKPIGNMKAREYYEYKTGLIPIIQEAFASLEEEYDVIIVEGAGSPAEINLKENDIVNMGLAKMLDLPVLLVGDIDLGGVFAQLLGTLEWLETEEKKRIKGLIINKFRGDVTLLQPGIDMLESRTGKKVLGVVPLTKAQIDEEDSVTVDLANYKKQERPIHSSEGNKDECSRKKGCWLTQIDNGINIYTIRLPHMSNFTDFTPLAMVPGVNIKYISKVPVIGNTGGANDIDTKDYTLPDMVIIPGTKSTISDLEWMKITGLADYILSLKGRVPIMGVCGGNQILGNSISDPYGIENENSVTNGRGLGLLNQETILGKEKKLTKVSGTLTCKEGFFTCLDGCRYEGYEIHSGVTDEAICDGDVFGTYVHGIFDKAEVTRAIIGGLLDRKNAGLEGIIDKDRIIDTIIDYSDAKNSAYENIAELLRESLDIEKLMKIMGM